MRINRGSKSRRLTDSEFRRGGYKLFLLYLPGAVWFSKMHLLNDRLRLLWCWSGVWFTMVLFSSWQWERVVEVLKEVEKIREIAWSPGSFFSVLDVVSLFSLALALQCLVLLREIFAFEKMNKMEEIIEWHLREQDEVRNDDHQHYSFEKE